MRSLKWHLAIAAYILSVGLSHGQDMPTSDGATAADYIQALRQQREEAQDKLAQAYMLIQRLQREIDLLKEKDEPKPAH